MFTGIVTEIGEVVAVEPRAQGLVRLKIACGYDADTIAVGASIACSGVCLTVVAHGKEGARAWFAVDAAAETLHFEIVSQESARALLELSLARRLPIGNGILTVDTDAQAWTRARPNEADKGGDAARAALSLVRLKRRLAAG